MSEEQDSGIPPNIKECYVVEIGSAGTIELKDIIIEILQRQLNHLDL